jgi:two-component system chemotaxis response regulator CheY
MARARILVIDDDPLFRNVVVTMLRKDFFVSVASEGSEGYYKALEHVPDLAIVDIQMAGWNGLKTLKAFRKNPNLTKVPVVMLTSDASKETVLAAVREGANDYVIKTSFSRDEFLRKVARSLLHRGEGLDGMDGEFDVEIGEPADDHAPDHAAPQPVPAGPVLSPSVVPPPSRRAAGNAEALQALIDNWE